MPKEKALMVPVDIKNTNLWSDPPEVFSFIDVAEALRTTREIRAERAKRSRLDSDTSLEEELSIITKRRRSSSNEPYVEPKLTSEQDKIITDTVNSLITLSLARGSQEPDDLCKALHSQLNSISHYTEEDREWNRYIERTGAGMPATPKRMNNLERQERSIVFMRYRALRKVYPITLEKFYKCYCALAARKHME